MQRIREPRLLLVEGRDEVNLFRGLIRDCFDDDPGIQVIDAGGKDKFSRNLRAIQTAAMAAPALQSIGVVRDADADASAAFDSVCDGIRSANYEPPMSHGEFSTGRPAIGVFIVPDGTEPGAIETLCRRSRQGNLTAACVDEYLKCLRSAMLRTPGTPTRALLMLISPPRRIPWHEWGKALCRGVGFCFAGVRTPLARFSTGLPCIRAEDHRLRDGAPLPSV